MFRNMFSSSSGTCASSGNCAAAVVAFACFFAGILVTAHVGQTVSQELISHKKREAVSALSEVRARLEGELSRTVAYGLGIKSYVARFVDEPFDPDTYEEISTDLIQTSPAIRSVGLAPGNILRAVFPVQSNQAAIGLNYRRNATQWPAIREAMVSRNVVIAGPLDLVQGGRAMLIRIPVFASSFDDQPMSERPYWGVVTLVVDKASLMGAAKVGDAARGLRVAVVNKNATGIQNSHIYGSPGLQDLDSVSLPLSLPGGLNWAVVGYPEVGWSIEGDQVWITQLVGGLVSLVFAVMAFLLVSEVYKVRSMALHDPLTGLANRRLLEDRMHQFAAMSERSGMGFEIFYIDLDAFKPVNDNFGHSVGDQLLIEIGQRLQQQTRQTDTVARVGGDEFIVLTPGNMPRTEKVAFLDRLSERVGQVFEYAGARIDVGTSIGTASFPGDATTVEDLLRVADTRMYAQKAKAKNTHQRDFPNDALPQAG